MGMGLFSFLLLLGIDVLGLYEHRELTGTQATTGEFRDCGALWLALAAIGRVQLLFIFLQSSFALRVWVSFGTDKIETLVTVAS
jgi:hypothetical protein